MFSWFEFIPLINVYVIVLNKTSTYLKKKGDFITPVKEN